MIFPVMIVADNLIFRAVNLIKILALSISIKVLTNFNKSGL